MAECIVYGSTEAPLLFCTRDRHYGIAGNFNIVRCASCGLARLNPMPTDEESTAYYGDDYYAYQVCGICLYGRSWHESYCA